MLAILKNISWKKINCQSSGWISNNNLYDEKYFCSIIHNVVLNYIQLHMVSHQFSQIYKWYPCSILSFFIFFYMKPDTVNIVISDITDLQLQFPFHIQCKIIFSNKKIMTEAFSKGNQFQFERTYLYELFSGSVVIIYHL